MIWVTIDTLAIVIFKTFFNVPKVQEVIMVMSGLKHQQTNLTASWQVEIIIIADTRVGFTEIFLLSLNLYVDLDTLYSYNVFKTFNNFSSKQITIII